MGQVAAVEQIHAHDGIANVDQGVVHGVVGRCAGEGLHVDINLIGREFFCGEGLGAAAAGQGFDGVGVFNTFIIARVGVAAEVGETGRIIQNLAFGHPAGFLIWVAFGIQVLKS